MEPRLTHSGCLLCLQGIFPEHYHGDAAFFKFLVLICRTFPFGPLHAPAAAKACSGGPSSCSLIIHTTRGACTDTAQNCPVASDSGMRLSCPLRSTWPRSHRGFQRSYLPNRTRPTHHIMMFINTIRNDTPSSFSKHLDGEPTLSHTMAALFSSVERSATSGHAPARFQS